MAEYITKEAAIYVFEWGEADVIEDCGNGYNFGFSRGIIKSAINAIPTADVAPVVHGRWVHSRYEDCAEQFELVKCSRCNHEAYAMAIYVRGGNYCPNCGAKMDGGVDDDGK